MDYNKVIIGGRLTKDPQLSYLPSQTAVCDFDVATNRRYVGKEGEKKEDVCFISAKAFGKIAENINKYFNKGDPIFIDGRLTFNSWTAKDGTKRSKHYVTVEGFQFLPKSTENTGESEPPKKEEIDDDLPF
jgi:single-strand DNA-binding protein